MRILLNIFMSTTITTAHEAYISGDRRKAFELLVPGTEPHTYLTILDALKSEKHKVSKKTLDLIDKFEGSAQAKLKLRAKL